LFALNERERESHEKCAVRISHADDVEQRPVIAIRLESAVHNYHFRICSKQLERFSICKE
jgi:hypothetical protein